MARQNGSRSSGRQWNAYSPPDPDSGQGSRGQASFFYYNPEGSSSQSQWWYNTFAEGQEQSPPPVEHNIPYYPNAAPGYYYPSYSYAPEHTGFDQKYREYRPQRPISPQLPRPPSRSMTPPPPPPPPQFPTPEYLAIAGESSQQLSDPPSSRKLLILDLNGTLLYRSPRVPRPKGKSKKNANNEEEQTSETSPPRPRVVHRRPYMPSFRSYIFHARTKAWLDVMIWSSAQPHNVDDMVDKCFGEQKDQLVAVWARDTLGLSETNYRQKVQTTKDLNTLWTRLFSPTPHNEQNGETSTGQEASEERAGPLHSALTTILMDDSPRKAELQPYNHLCIKEYAADTRAKDLSMLQMEKHKAVVEQTKEDPPPVPPVSLPIQPSPIVEQVIPFQHDGTMGIQPDATLLQSTTSSSSLPLIISQDEIPGLLFSDPSKLQEQRLVLLQEQASATKKRKRKDKKKTKVDSSVEIGEIKFDETLLAIIGILDEMKSQSNVSNWVKIGGLWGPFPPPAFPTQSTTSLIMPSGSGQADADSTDLSVDDGQGTEKKRRRDPVAIIEELPLQQPTGNDAVAAPAEEPAPSEKQVEANPAIMWFDSPSTMRHWVEKGRSALESLGITIAHGIDK